RAISKKPCANSTAATAATALPLAQAKEAEAAPPEAARPGAGGLKLRLASAFVLMPLAIAAVWFGGWALAGLVILAGAGMGWEWARLSVIESGLVRAALGSGICRRTIARGCRPGACRRRSRASLDRGGNALAVGPLPGAVMDCRGRGGTPLDAVALRRGLGERRRRLCLRPRLGRAASRAAVLAQQDLVGRPGRARLRRDRRFCRGAHCRGGALGDGRPQPRAVGLRPGRRSRRVARQAALRRQGFGGAHPRPWRAARPPRFVADRNRGAGRAAPPRLRAGLRRPPVNPVETGAFFSNGAAIFCYGSQH